ncbi:hypothetical protein PR048_028015 [Dryococelus australis]|uniref:Uncharacterized protein n=1 Tax=Dryococelus australis TaxID=614101 RepID=A0ABQ9GI56_9NEOP|nr:hypothetical protein PR048_028015 [Dryococelus australis]
MKTDSSRLHMSPKLRRDWLVVLWGSPRIFACGNRIARCRWSAGFLGDLPFPLPLNSGAAPYSSRISLIGSQDFDATMEQRGNARAGETGDPRENPPTSGIVLMIPTCEDPGATHLGIEPASPRREARGLGTAPPRPPFSISDDENIFIGTKSKHYQPFANSYIHALINKTIKFDIIFRTLPMRYVSDLCTETGATEYVGSNKQEILVTICPTVERRRNAMAGETRDPRGNPPTSGIVRHDSHICYSLLLYSTLGVTFWNAAVSADALGPRSSARTSYLPTTLECGDDQRLGGRARPHQVEGTRGDLVGGELSEGGEGDLQPVHAPHRAYLLGAPGLLAVRHLVAEDVPVRVALQRRLQHRPPDRCARGNKSGTEGGGIWSGS